MRIQQAFGLSIVVGFFAIPGYADFPRMDDGKPDFSGTYNLSTLTPFARDPKFGERLNLSAAEAKALLDTSYGRMEEAAAPVDPERDALQALDGEARQKGVDNSGSYVPGSHDYHWFECGGRHCDLFEVDGQFRTSILIDPPDGRMPAVTEAGQARRTALRSPGRPGKYPGEAWWLAEGLDPFGNPESLALGDRCIFTGVVVPARPVVYNNMRTIVQSPDRMLIMTEWMHWPRVVRFDAKHLPDDMRSLSGDSIGWWEGDTLVVETTNFLAALRVPREGLRVVERFSPIDDESFLYRFTVHDSDYEKSYTGEFPWNKSDDRLYEFACHEGNYAMSNTLRGARVLERKWIEQHGKPEQRKEN